MGKNNITELKVQDKEPTAPTIDQVRELLFGQEQRSLESEIEELRAELQNAREDHASELSALRDEMRNTFDQLNSSRRNNLNTIGEAIEAVGRTISGLQTK